MRIKVFTLFPEMLRPMLGESILGRAMEAGLIDVQLIDIREYTQNKHRNTDDYPFGGGAGMVMMAQPIVDAFEANVTPGARRIYLSPRGRRLNQRIVEELAQEEELVLLCGHYEGVDQRALDMCIDEELSIGDYVLTGGELGALVVIDSVSRLIPGVLGSGDSSDDESFSAGDGPAAGLLEYPQYTRPADFRGMKVPDALLGGNHATITKWRREQALEITRARRPDMLEKASLSPADEEYLRALDAREMLTKALDEAGVAWEAMDGAECAEFEQNWLAAFVPAENLRSARRKCLNRKGALGGLEQAFIQKLVPETEDNDGLCGCFVYLTRVRTGVKAKDANALEDVDFRRFDGLCIADGELSASRIFVGGRWRHARRSRES